MSEPVAEQAPATVVPVRAGAARYDVIIGAGALADIDRSLAAAATGAPAPTRLALIADAGLPPQLVADVEARLARLGPVSTLTLEVDEQRKSLATLERVLANLARAGLERSGGVVVALGGGIVGDIAGFAAATYRRGVRVVQCPTTLLAMVDAAVGGKTGVNLVVPADPAAPAPAALRKNFVGAFHQPQLVIADVRALDSLPPRELRCGLAECFKHGLISADLGDPGLFDWTDRAASAIATPGAASPATLVELVARNVAIKAAIVAADEREEAPGGRMLLNLGHTFAHAIEPLAGVSPTADPADAPLRHGEAVALGLVAASALSASLGLASPALLDRVRAALARAGLPTAVAGLPQSAQIRAAMAHDKKSTGGRMRLVAPLDGARATIIDEPGPEHIDRALDAIRPATA